MVGEETTLIADTALSNVLVTGGAGFIGSTLVRFLVEKGIRVNIVDSLTYAGHRINLEEPLRSELVALHVHDICDRAAVSEILAAERPDAVLHLAAETHVDRSVDGPATFVTSNVDGTFALLEEVRKYWSSIRREARSRFRFLHVSTDEIYGSVERGESHEGHAMNPRSPYAATKASSNHLVHAWHVTYGLPVVTVVSSNNYGPRQYPEKFIPTIVRRGLNQEAIPVYGAGENVRDWMHVDDHVAAIWRILTKGTPGKVYNVGAGRLSTNNELAANICAILDQSVGVADGTHARLIEHVTDRPGHDLRYSVDTRRLRSELNWSPSVEFLYGLERTVRWYIENQDWSREVMTGSYDGERLGLATQSGA